MNKKRLSPLRAIREKCIDCSGGSTKEVKLCVIPDCPLYPFRLGKNPSRVGIGNRKPEFLKKSCAEIEV